MAINIQDIPIKNITRCLTFFFVMISLLFNMIQIGIQVYNAVMFVSNSIESLIGNNSTFALIDNRIVSQYDKIDAILNIINQTRYDNFICFDAYDCRIHKNMVKCKY